MSGKLEVKLEQEELGLRTSLCPAFDPTTSKN